MNVKELADAMEIRASIRRKAVSRKSVQENANDRLADQLDEAAAMLRQQQAEIEALKNGLSSAYWHDTFVEVKKPNSDLIYRFRLDDVCEHGTYDGACKECYIKEQAK